MRIAATLLRISCIELMMFPFSPMPHRRLSLRAWFPAVVLTLHLALPELDAAEANNLVARGGVLAIAAPRFADVTAASDFCLQRDGAMLPPARAGHVAIWTGSDMIVWGGLLFPFPPFGNYNLAGARYNPTAAVWRMMARRDS